MLDDKRFTSSIICCTWSSTPASRLSTATTASMTPPLSRWQRTSSSKFLQPPFEPPLESTCLASSARLPHQSFQLASSYISLNFVQSNVTYSYLNYSLVQPCFISFVAIPRTEKTSAIIRIMMSHFCGHRHFCVYLETSVFFRRLEISKRVSWLARTPLAAWEPYVLGWPALCYWEYTLKGEHQFQQRLPWWVRMPVKWSERAGLRYAHVLGHPGQRFQLSRKMQGRLWLDQAILSIDRHYSGTDRALGLAVEGQKGCRWESCMIAAGWRVDVEEDLSLCVRQGVRDRLLRHY